MEKIGISQFKATCLRLLARVKRQNKPLTVTKNGEPLVVIFPAPEQHSRPRFGFAKDTVSGVGDLIAPVTSDSEWLD